MAVMKDNVPALLFWEKVLDLMGIQYTKEKHNEEGIDGISYEFNIPNKLIK